jgi:hypothetical protein
LKNGKKRREVEAGGKKGEIKLEVGRDRERC